LQERNHVLSAGIGFRWHEYGARLRPPGQLRHPLIDLLVYLPAARGHFSLGLTAGDPPMAGAAGYGTRIKQQGSSQC
jgi:hypothetical protein